MKRPGSLIGSVGWLCALSIGLSKAFAADSLSREQIDFFENKVRPVLADHCYECHSTNARKIKGGLVLDSKAGWVTGGDSGPAIVPGQPDKSLLIKAVRYEDEDLAMPPKGKKLSTAQIADLVQWVKMGAPDLRTENAAAKKPAVDLAKAKEFWSFRPIANVTPPKVKNRNWAQSPIDTFVLAKLEEKKLTPNGDADKRALIRRATYDLIGLPPTPEEISGFLNDKSKQAFAKVVDRLLASRHYGERWGRHWMDLVRYADTAGDNSDYPIPQLYLYRNYIIDSLNRDKPFDQFIREQIAGDLLPATNQAQRNEQVIATGYIALSRRFGSVVDRYPQHQTIEDTLDNMGRTFMGLSLSCARCHDHKFDPISARDYYGLYGIFESTKYAFPGIELLKVQKDFVPLVAKEEHERILQPFRDKERELQKHHNELASKRKSLEDEKSKLDKKIKSAPEADRATLTAQNQKLYLEIENVRKKVRSASEAIEKHKKNSPAVPSAYAVQDGKPANTRIQIKGDPDRKGDVVPRKFLDLLGGQLLSGEQTNQSGRLQLANWIAATNNPLTARVMVNRVWHYHFGAGLVRTPSDFGTRGLAPSHPELLDWLARRFVDGGWSLKKLHREILLSRTYQMSSDDNETALAADPDNALHWRFNRRRLDAESLRDTLMFVSGTLDLTPMNEPHPFPPQGKWEFTQHHPFKDVYTNSHRSVYLMIKRLTALPYFQTFDGPDPNANTSARDSSVTPLQALYFMNSEFIHEQAKHFGKRVATAATSDKTRLDLAFELTLGRQPTREERRQVEEFLAQPRVTRVSNNASDAAVEQWTGLARVLFRMNEFMYVD